MGQTVEKIMETKLETFAKDMIGIQMKNFKALQRRSKKLKKIIKEAKRSLEEKLTRQKEVKNRGPNRATMRQTGEKVLEPKLNIFEKDMIDVEMRKLKMLQRKSKKLENAIKEAKRTAEEKLIRQKETKNREPNGVTMGQTVEKVMEAKLETFEKNMIGVQMKKLKALERKSKKLEKTIKEAKRTAKEKLNRRRKEKRMELP